MEEVGHIWKKSKKDRDGHCFWDHVLLQNRTITYIRPKYHHMGETEALFRQQEVLGPLCFGLETRITLLNYNYIDKCLLYTCISLRYLYMMYLIAWEIFLNGKFFFKFVSFYCGNI